MFFNYILAIYYRANIKGNLLKEEFYLYEGRKRYDNQREKTFRYPVSASF